MTDYARVEDFSVKDGLTTGDPEKVITGSDIDSELDAVVTAVASKEDSANKGAANGYCGLGAGGLVDPTDLPTATTSAIGALETATDAEAVAVTATDKIVTPSNLDNVLAEPPAIGGTTAAAITGTTITGTAGVYTTLTVGGTAVVDEDRTITSGNGLTGGGNLSGNLTLAVGAGTGIGVNADDVELDISGLTSMTSAPAVADTFLYNDGGTMKQMSWNEVAIPSNNDSDAHTFADSDVGTIRYYTGSGGHTWTMPTGVGQDDCWIMVINSGSGTLTLAGSGVTVTSANSLLDVPAGGMVTLIRETSTVWFAGGNLQ